MVKLILFAFPLRTFRITCDTRMYLVVCNKQDIFEIFISLSVITHKLNLVFALHIIQFCKLISYMSNNTMIAPLMDHSVGSTIHA